MFVRPVERGLGCPLWSTGDILSCKMMLFGVCVCVCFSPLKYENSSFCSSCQKEKRRRRRKKRAAIISVLVSDQELQTLREYFPKLGVE